MRTLALLLMGIGLGACTFANRTYSLDGVSIVLEQAKGPSPTAMALAVNPFRGAVREQLQLEAEAEAELWRGLSEIRWAIRPVLDGAFYDRPLRRIDAVWQTCALDVPLYQALAHHYGWDIAETAEDVEAHEAWAEQLQDAHYNSACVTDSKSPWPW